jgi:excinuclease ABC subunit A
MHHGDDIMMVIEHDSQEVRYFSRTLMCPTSGISYPNPEPNNFSFNSPKGACDSCNGLGTINQINSKKIIPNPKLSITQGGFAPLGDYKNTWIFKQLETIGEKYNFKITDPIDSISDVAMNVILNGGKDKFAVASKTLGITKEYKIEFEGISNFIKNQFDESFSIELLHSLGSINNLKSVSIEHKRLKVIVKDLKKVNASSLTKMNAPAILKGQEITILVKNHSNQVYQYLNDKIKGV